MSVKVKNGPYDYSKMTIEEQKELSKQEMSEQHFDTTSRNEKIAGEAKRRLDLFRSRYIT